MEELRLFVEQMRSTSSGLDKVEILKQQSDFIKKVLEYTYNPYKQYYVTSKTCKKNFNIRNMFPDEDLFDLLDDLTNRNLTGHDAIAAVNSFTNVNEEYEDLIHIGFLDYYAEGFDSSNEILESIVDEISEVSLEAIKNMKATINDLRGGKIDGFIEESRFSSGFKTGTIAKQLKLYKK